MAMDVYDSGGKKFIVGSGFFYDAIDKPLVAERREKYSFPFGDAELVQIAFSGIYIVYGDMVMKENKRLRFDVVEQHDLVEMHFTLKGIGAMTNFANGQTYMFKENEHNLHYTPQFSGEGNYKKGQQHRFFEVHFTTEYFFELTKNSSPALMSFAESVAANKAADFCKENLPITLAMHQCIHEIMNCKVTGGLKLMFLQSKCIELLILQAQAYEDALGKSSTSIIRTDFDKERILFARDYLIQNAQQPPTLRELSKIAGINEFKLKKGFREIFNTTVFGFLSDHKLGQAKDLLGSGNISIKELADDLGYSSVQHFSTAFKKKFGVTPGRINN